MLRFQGKRPLCLTHIQKMLQNCGKAPKGRVVPSLDVLNRGLQFAGIRIATGLQRFQIAQLEPQGQEPVRIAGKALPFCMFKTGFRRAI